VITGHPDRILTKSHININDNSFYAARATMSPARSQTRGFILSTLGGGVALNQNQIAKLLGFDRTVVHRASAKRSILEYSTFQYPRRNILPLPSNKIPGKFLPPDQEFSRRIRSNRLN
jgi:hypothetical protein